MHKNKACSKTIAVFGCGGWQGSYFPRGVTFVHRRVTIVLCQFLGNEIESDSLVTTWFWKWFMSLTPGHMCVRLFIPIIDNYYLYCELFLMMAVGCSWWYFFTLESTECVHNIFIHTVITYQLQTSLAAGRFSEHPTLLKTSTTTVRIDIC